MIKTIQCTNPACTSPHKPPTFQWDASEYLEPAGQVVAVGTPRSERFPVPCPYCKTVNVVGIIGLKIRDEDRIVRE